MLSFYSFLIIHLISYIAHSQSCTLPEQLTIEVEVCNGDSDTTGTADGFTATFCDKTGYCESHVLGPDFPAGESLLLPSIDASNFKDQILQVDLTGTDSQDGLCIAAFSMNGEEFVSEPFWLEGTCIEEADYHQCPCNSYPTGSVIFKCQEWQGSSDLNLLIQEETFITDIPAGVVGLTLQLTAEVDLDLQLYSGFQTDDNKVCLAGYGCQHGSQAPSDFTHNGMDIHFSGDDRTTVGDGVISETITIDTVTSPLSLFVKAYATGVGNVTYSWDGTEDCSFNNYGCAQCDDWAGCKNGKVPVCDGSVFVRCVEPESADVARQECDEYQTSGYAFATECVEYYNVTRTECTEYPTGSPATSSPSGTPSWSPETSSPSRTPSGTPFTSEPTTEPTTAPVTTEPSQAPIVPPRCEKAEEFIVEIETCSGDTAGSADMTLSARFCDVDNVCQTIELAPSPNNADSPYTYNVHEAAEYAAFTDHMDTVSFIPSSEDGVCIESMVINGNNTFNGPLWWDAECSGQTGECMCSEYEDSNVIWDCQEFQGSSSMAMIIGTVTWVTNIPVGVRELNMTLTAGVDFDLQLYKGFREDIDVDSQQCFVGYDCEHPDFGTIITEDPDDPSVKAVILFSGDDTEAPVQEYIRITRTLEPLSLYVKSYGTGTGIAHYSWSFIEPCDFERFGCRDCNEFAGCKDGLVPVCDGSKSIVCVDPAEQATEQAKCDEYSAEQAEDVCVKDFQLEFCDSWSPTATPSDVPTKTPTNFPSVSPTIRPDCWHFNLGQCGCPDGLPLDVLWILDSSTSIPDGEWNNFLDTLADFVMDDYPDTGRMALMQFSTQTHIVFNFMDGGDKESWSTDIKNIERQTGATWTRRALNDAMNFVWQPYLDNYDTEGRVLATILITDGVPSYLNRGASSQSPCESGEPRDDMIKQFFEYGIEIQTVVVGEWEEGIAEETLGCLNDNEDHGGIHEFEDYNQPEAVIDETVQQYILSCYDFSFSEYNGRYSVVLEDGQPAVTNGRYVYKHSENWIVYWGGEGFLFYDPAGVLGEMEETDGDLTLALDFKFPRNGSDFLYNAPNGIGELRPAQQICCDDMPAPSRMPSVVPTQSPILGTRPPTTSYPTVSPETTTPTRNPSTTTPTKNPVTTAPTSSEPSSAPVTTQPTMNPVTTSPTTSEPSSSPSTSAPTTTEPTRGPIIGTLPPSTPDPTTSPTTNPTPSPSNSPDTSAPTSLPSPFPSKSPSHSPDTTSPSTHPVTTDPTPGPTSGPTTSPTTPPSPSPTTSPTSGPSPVPSPVPSKAPTKWDCTKQSSLTVIMTLCSAFASSGSLTAEPVAHFTDIHGVSVSYTLAAGGQYAKSSDTAPFTAGNTYEWVLPTDGFSDQVVDMTLDMGTEVSNLDGLCITDLEVVSEYLDDPTGTVHYNSMFSNPQGMWLDGENCEARTGSCDCGTYFNGGVVFQCQAWSGSSDINMIIGTETWVTDIPKYVNELVITLESNADLDLKLYACNEFDDFECFEQGACIAGYGCANSDAGSFTHNGMNIFFSGDHREAPVTEYIQVDRITETMQLMVRAYETGTGTVTYNWAGIDPCLADAIGCKPCDEYIGCKDNLEPVCFGNEVPECVLATEKAARQATCDDFKQADIDNENAYCGTIELELRDCIAPPTVSPTRTPSRSPSTSIPSDMPSVSPSTSKPSTSPDTSGPTVSPTRNPTARGPCEKADEVVIEIGFCDVTTAGSDTLQLSVTFTDVDGNTGTHVLVSTGTASAGSVATYTLDSDDLAVYTNQIITWKLSTSSNDGVGISSFAMNGQSHWNDAWYDSDITCIWIDGTCEPNDNSCACGQYPDNQSKCQDWAATSDLNLILGTPKRFIMNIPTSVDNIQIEMIAQTDFDINLLKGHHDENTSPDDLECLLGYRCQHSQAGNYNFDGTSVTYSGDMRNGNPDVVETISIQGRATEELSIWVHAWNTGTGSVRWTWDGLQDCTPVESGECLSCGSWTCPVATPDAACFGAWEPNCYSSTATVPASTLQSWCDDYNSGDMSTRNGECSSIDIDLPECNSAAPSVSPTRQPTPEPSAHPHSSSPTKEPTPSPTVSPTWPCCDEADVIEVTLGICLSGDCAALTDSASCEALGKADTDVHGDCYWMDNVCNSYTTTGSDSLELQLDYCDVRGNCASSVISGPFTAGSSQTFEIDAKSQGVQFQVTDVTLKIADGSTSDDGVCVDNLSMKLDNLDHNDVLINSRTWFDNNCEDVEKGCPCLSYPVEASNERCQVTQGTSNVTMTAGQSAWITDIPPDQENVVVTLEANVDYDLYAILTPDDYDGKGSDYDFSTVDGAEFLLICLSGSTCLHPQSSHGMVVTYEEQDEKSGTITVERTTASLVVYVVGLESGDATVDYNYDSVAFCQIDAHCSPCGTYECKDDLMSVCDGVQFPVCASPDVGTPTQKSCDDNYSANQNGNCGLSFELTPEDCRDCYTDPPTIASLPPTKATTLSPTVATTTTLRPTAEDYVATLPPTPYDPCTCETPIDIRLSITFCDEPETAGSNYAKPEIQVCDAAGICNTFSLPEGWTLEGTKTERWWGLGANGYNEYEDYLVTASLYADSPDGFCVSAWSINDYVLPVHEEEEGDVMWIDSDCTGYDEACDCGYFPVGSIQFQCQAWTGSSQIDLFLGQEVFIAIIPENVQDLSVTLEASVDLDLKLYTTETYCLAGYECEYPIGSSFEFEGMTITFTGDDRSDPVFEKLQIDSTTRPLELRVKAFGNGNGTVTYSWSGIDPCPAEQSGCNECTTFEGCKDGLEPVCDGSANIRCVAVDELAIARASCDNYVPADFFSPEERANQNCGTVTENFPPCNTCWPTQSPSRTPTKSPTPEPTPMPTPSPTLGPTPSPTNSPTPSPTNSPTTGPTTSPTSGPTGSPSTSPTTPPTPSPTDSDPPTTSPTSSPTSSPTPSPTSSPTTSPTVCPYICVWDCVTEEGCIESCAGNVAAATAAANAQCAADMEDLKSRVDTAETAVDTLETTCTECADLNLNVELLNQILNDEQTATWTAVVESGVSCSYVSTTFCDRITHCTLNNGVCEDNTARPSLAPNSSPPSAAPVPCAIEIDAWQAVVDNGTACAFVPLDTCNEVTQCEIVDDACVNKQ